MAIVVVQRSGRWLYIGIQHYLPLSDAERNWTYVDTVEATRRVLHVQHLPQRDGLLTYVIKLVMMHYTLHTSSVVDTKFFRSFETAGCMSSPIQFAAGLHIRSCKSFRSPPVSTCCSCRSRTRAGFAYSPLLSRDTSFYHLPATSISTSSLSHSQVPLPLKQFFELFEKCRSTCFSVDEEHLRYS
jgi:hypothetical protein